jgi:predicted ATP-grasp superfamily ATP-dependent carboligase
MPGALAIWCLDMSGSKPNRVGVVVLGSGHHGGLAIARSLGRLGVPVYAVDTDWWETAFTSRYCRGRFFLNPSSDPTGESLHRLLEIGRKLGGRPLLIPMTDQNALWVAEHAEALAEEFRFTRLDPSLVRTLCDKSQMQKLAERCGVPVAHSVLPHCRESLERFASASSFPLMVKATDPDRLRQRTGGTKFLVHKWSELIDLYEKAWDGQSANFLVQEFIPGEDWMFDGYFDDQSRCVFGITGKKIRRFPAKTGVTSLGVCLRNDAVQNLTREFMSAIGYHGILDIGYRRDCRDGQYKVMDVNPRIGSSFRLFAAQCGMDVARVLYLHLTGCPIPPYQSIEGRKWITEDFDLFSSIRSARDGSLSLKEWSSSFNGVQELACFALDDPLPFFMMALADGCELSKWLRRRGTARNHPVLVDQPALIATTRRH